MNVVQRFKLAFVGS